MNPHFLFNALSSIHEHILENEAEAAAGYLAKFSKLMRHVLEMSRLNEVTIQREPEVLGLCGNGTNALKRTVHLFGGCSTRCGSGDHCVAANASATLC
ncbi:MAG: histidine kinase [Flavobacteriales bacterium]|nr:histidine kinase [Flavobacteriales bacterium]